MTLFERKPDRPEDGGFSAKLVRDRVPELLKERGVELPIRVADETEYDHRLIEKLAEEVSEFRDSEDLEELADVLEVILALAERRGVSPGELEAIRARKAAARGTFSKRIVMASPPLGEIRRAAAEDARALQLLLNDAYAEHLAAGLNFTAATQDEVSTRRQIRRHEVYLLEIDGEPIATITLRDKEPDGDVRHIYINKLAVARAQRGRGFAKRLLSFAEAVARERGINVLRLDTAIPTTDLVGLYSNVGYAVKKTHQWDGKTYLSVIMERALE